jgi:ABC-type phosphate transport system permease subunit
MPWEVVGLVVGVGVTTFSGAVTVAAVLSLAVVVLQGVPSEVIGVDVVYTLVAVMHGSEVVKEVVRTRSYALPG